MYNRIQHLRPKSFKRKCGVRRDTFEKMVEVLKPKLIRNGKRETILIQSGEFSLPGKKHLQPSSGGSVLLVDGTERPIERPKKTSACSIVASNESIR